MRVFILFNLAVFTIVHTTATLPTTAWAGNDQEERVPPAILALDAVIQKRFEKVDRRFGIVRVAVEAHGFAPEDDAEVSSLRELDDAHLRVALYLGGRRLLGPQPDERGAQISDRVKGPAFITHGRFPATPAAESMWDEGRRAFAAFERKEPQYEFEIDNWNVVARPVRAGSDTCLMCHRSTGTNRLTTARSDLRVGDVLGVVLYAYQTANQ
jgi:hypothetical protein